MARIATSSARTCVRMSDSVWFSANLLAAIEVVAMYHLSKSRAGFNAHEVGVREDECALEETRRNLPALLERIFARTSIGGHARRQAVQVHDRVRVTSEDEGRIGRDTSCRVHGSRRTRRHGGQ